MCLHARTCARVRMHARYVHVHADMLIGEFDCTIQNPMIAMTLPEFTSGYPSLVGPYTFMVGILDHPAMGGSSIWKSDDEQHIMDWLDEREAKKDKVLYVAFGSEVTVTEELMRLLAGAFKKAASHFKVPPKIWHVTLTCMLDFGLVAACKQVWKELRSSQEKKIRCFMRTKSSPRSTFPRAFL